MRGVGLNWRARLMGQTTLCSQSLKAARILIGHRIYQALSLGRGVQHKHDTLQARPPGLLQNSAESYRTANY